MSTAAAAYAPMPSSSYSPITAPGIIHRTPSGFEYGMLFLDYPERPIVRRGIHKDKTRPAFLDVIANVFETPYVVDLAEELRGFDASTYNHTRRVFTHALDSAFHFGLHKEDKYGIEGVVDLGIGAVGHDAGKMLLGGNKKTAYNIINDPSSPLPENSQRLIRAHPAVSYSMLAPISERAAQIALRHHEFNKFDPYPFDGASMKYEGKARPVDQRPALPGVFDLSQHLAASDMRDGRCSFYDDRSNRVYQKNDSMTPHEKADWLMRAFAGRPAIMAYATHSLVMGRED